MKARFVPEKVSFISFQSIFLKVCVIFDRIVSFSKWWCFILKSFTSFSNL